MASSINGRVVAPRTRAAAQILGTPDLLAIYESVGGLSADLEVIRDSGLEVEALLLAQSQTRGEGIAATKDVARLFASLQKEYVAVMAVVQAVRRDLEKAGAHGDVLTAVDRILLNEAQVVVVTEIQDDGTTKRKKSRSESQEALRAEIGKDAKALLDLKETHEALTRRKVTIDRLKKLADGAAQLSGKLAKRAAKKGAGKETTAAKKEAMLEQHMMWKACRRLLELTAQQDARVAALLDEVTQASRRRKKEPEENAQE